MTTATARMTMRIAERVLAVRQGFGAPIKDGL